MVRIDWYIPTGTKVLQEILYVSSAPINSLLLVDENVLATGDDTGGIRLWDQRKEGPFPCTEGPGWAHALSKPRVHLCTNHGGQLTRHESR